MACIYFDDHKELCKLLEKWDKDNKYIDKNYQYDYCKSDKSWKVQECSAYDKYANKR